MRVVFLVILSPEVAVWQTIDMNNIHVTKFTE
jgi:hypothetical protein